MLIKQAIAGLNLITISSFILAQTETLVQNSNLNTVLIGAVATALTGTTGVITWLVKRMFSGDMLHRDIAAELKARDEDLKKMIDITSKAVTAIEAGHTREDRLWGIVQKTQK